MYRAVEDGFCFVRWHDWKLPPRGQELSVGTLGGSSVVTEMDFGLMTQAPPPPPRQYAVQ